MGAGHWRSTMRVPNEVRVINVESILRAKGADVPMVRPGGA